LSDNVLTNTHERAAVLVISILLLGIIVYFSSLIDAVLQGEITRSSFKWIDSLGIRLSFYLDGLSLFFALLILVFGFLIFLYSYPYMKHDPQRNRFFCYLFLFMGSMLGVVLSANTISLFVFWELTSLASFLLIGFNNQKEESRRAARQALIVTAGGGLALMSGLILLEIITHTGFDLTETLQQSTTVGSSELLVAAIVLIALGAISKSAQFPLHFWLPNAMAAPTPVSAYLHSATMVKAGVYLIFRLNPLFGEVELWAHILGITGAITMVWGAFKAFQQDDLKRVLAYTTISALGIFFMMTGIGGKASINAVLIYVLAHALYKGALFLAAGNIDHQAGTRSIAQLSDLRSKMPYTAAIVILACASMAGIFPFVGFVGKESLYGALYHSGNEWATVYLVLLFLASTFFTAVTIDIVYSALLKKGKLNDQQIREASIFMITTPMLLVVAGLVVGIIPGVMIEPLLQWSAASVTGAQPSMHLKLWHGFNFVFLLSMVTLIFGTGLFLMRRPLRKFRKVYWLESDFIYDKMLLGITQMSRYLTRVIQNGFLRNYIAMVLLVFSFVVVYVVIDGSVIHPIVFESLLEGIQIYELVIIAFITMAVIFLFKTRSRLIVTATFGIVGYSIALAYTLFSAPDVAITQFLAETLTLILLVLILHRLPSYTLKKRIAHIKYLPVALLFGVVMNFTSFIMLNQEKDSALKTYFLEKSISEGKGLNAVNVILVDFRALDTLGEITVLTVTMLGIIALLEIKSKKAEL